MEWTVSSRGKPQLVFHSYIFTLNKTREDKRYWRCIESNCAVRCVTMGLGEGDSVQAVKEPPTEHPSHRHDPFHQLFYIFSDMS